MTMQDPSGGSVHNDGSGAAQEAAGGAAESFDAVVIGGGPAGLTAGTYLARARRSTLVLERNMAGGQMALTELIENYPGFPEGISGFELADRMKLQAGKFGAELREITAVTSIELREGAHTIVTDQGLITARSLVLAPGVVPRTLGIPGESEFFGRGVSSCATCDGFLYRGGQVAVVGGGDTAVEEGMFLTKFAERVTVIHRRDELRASAIAQERAFANEKMSWLWNSRPRRVIGDDTVSALEYEDIKTGEVGTLSIDGVFVFVGQLPNTEVLRGLVELDAAGYIVTDDQLRTKQPGVFACGDARANHLKQIAYAVGEAAFAAVQTDKYLDTL